MTAMRKTFHFRTRLLISVLLASITVSVRAADAVCPDLALKEIKDALGNGGHVVVFRHSDKCGSEEVPPAQCTDNSFAQQTKCEDKKQRLSKKGRQLADTIGRHAKPLIRPVEVYASTSCRALETAEIAFGALSLRNVTDDVKTLSGIRKLASLDNNRNAPQENIVIVTHWSALKKISGQGFKCGEAAILKRAEETGYTCIARVEPNKWQGGTRKPIEYYNSQCKN